MSSSIEHSYSLREFYANKTILVTGCTGFLGHVVIEKLLRSFPDIKQIYMIIRGKRGKTSRQRIAEYFDNEIFSRLKDENPDGHRKAHGLEGDMTSENCGLTAVEVATLQNEVNIIIHAAATVRFNDDLKNATNINVKGTGMMLKMAMGMKMLQSFIYVSTTFSNASGVLEEQIYPNSMTPEKLIPLVELLDPSTLSNITPVLLGKWPNTYMYTKSVAENLIYSYRDKLPLIIFRPSIITATAFEPIPSWVNKYVGPYGYMTTTGLGFSRAVYCPNKHKNANMVPCDLVANAIIALVWSAGMDRRNSIRIVNYSSEANPMTWGEFSIKMLSGYNNAPFEKAVWYPINFVATKNWYYKFLFVFLEILPSFVADMPNYLLQKKPFYMEFCSKLQKSRDEQSYILENEFVFKANNINEIWNKLSEDDKRLLNFDIRSIDWDDYLSGAMWGIKKYLLGENVTQESLERAKNRCFWLFLLHQLTKLGLIALILYLFRHIFRLINF